MPHCTILYTPNLETSVDLTALCRTLGDAMLSTRDETGKQVFPTGGTRVLAFPATHYAVADGSGDYGFIYIHLRMGRGRSEEVHNRVGRVMEAEAMRVLAPLLERQAVGLTIQIDVGAEVFDSKNGSLRPLFAKS